MGPLRDEQLDAIALLAHCFLELLPSCQQAVIELVLLLLVELVLVNRFEMRRQTLPVILAARRPQINAARVGDQSQSVVEGVGGRQIAAPLLRRDQLVSC